MNEHKVTMADDAYTQTQGHILLVARFLVDPSVLGKPTLDLFIERAERSMSLGPVLHPSEFREGADKLREVLAHAKALRDARDAIAKASGLDLGALAVDSSMSRETEGFAELEDERE